MCWSRAVRRASRSDRSPARSDSLLCSWAGTLGLDRLDLLLEARDGRLELGGVRAECLQILPGLRAQLTLLDLREISRARPGCWSGRWSGAAAGPSSTPARAPGCSRSSPGRPRDGWRGRRRRFPYSSVTCPPVVETNWPLSSIRLTNRCLRPADGIGNQALNLRRGERLLGDVGCELPRQRRDRNGERLSGARKSLLDRGLDVDVRVQLVDREDAELLLDVGVLEDRGGLVGKLVRVEHLGLNPVREHRDAATRPTRARRASARERGAGESPWVRGWPLARGAAFSLLPDDSGSAGCARSTLITLEARRRAGITRFG